MLQQVKHLVTASQVKHLVTASPQTNEGQKRATCPAILLQKKRVEIRLRCPFYRTF